ncbi:FecR family protein [Parabacteroides distasonis]|uniref:FecR family protein n=1 Tax=Parabacteroides distasonis TaxID=823 RepID=UPI003F287A2B
METRKEVIKQMGDEMKEDIFLEVNRRIHRNLRKRFWLKASAIAASIALLLGVSNYISYHEGYKNQNSQMVEMANPMGMRSSIVLSDGTRVILNAGTTLSYPTAFVSNQREVKVNGEAFFEVSHDKDHPFIVSAENVKVKVLGTKFNVKAYKEDDHIEVTLTEGKVGVGLRGHHDMMYISPGQQALFNKMKQSFSKYEVNLDYYTSWKEGKFYFKSVTFLEIAKQLERRFNVHISVEPAKLQRTVFSGDFVRGENLEQILRIITADKRTDYTMRGDSICIYEK